MDTTKSHQIGENERADQQGIYYYDDGVSYQLGDGRALQVREDGPSGIIITLKRAEGDTSVDFLSIEHTGAAERLHLGLSKHAAMVLWLLLAHMNNEQFFTVDDMHAVVPATHNRRSGGEPHKSTHR